MRWNAIIDTGGTPPRLMDKSRKPGEIAAEITAIADENDCNVEIWFDRFSWDAYITLWGRSSNQNQANANARSALQVLEAHDVRQELNTDEKERHPNAGMGYDARS